MAERYASLAPSTFIQGGLLNNVDVEVIGSKFCRFDYQGHADEVPALCWTLQPLDGGAASDQFLSAGNLKDWIPSADGERLVATSEDSPQGLNNSSNLALILMDLVKFGYNEARLSNEPASAMVGLRFHVVRKKVDSRAGGTVSDKEVMRVAKVIKFPWEKGTPIATTGTAPGPVAVPTPTTTTAPAAGASSGTAASNVVLSDALIAAVKEAVPRVMNGQTSMTLGDLKKKVYGELTAFKTAERTAAAKRVIEDVAFMGDCMLELDSGAGTVSLIQL